MSAKLNLGQGGNTKYKIVEELTDILKCPQLPDVTSFTREMKWNEMGQIRKGNELSGNISSVLEHKTD